MGELNSDAMRSAVAKLRQKGTLNEPTLYLHPEVSEILGKNMAKYLETEIFYEPTEEEEAALWES